MRRPVSRGMRYAPNVRRARSTMKRRPAMKKISTVRVNGNMIFRGHQLTIGVDLGDRCSCYCVLDEAGEVLLEQKVATTPEAMKQIFEKIPRSLIAMETGTPLVTHTYIKPSSNQRSTTSREASAAGRL